MSSMMEATAFVGSLQSVGDKWKLVEIIGEGTYGEVYRGENNKKQQAAIKVVENNPNKLDELQNEIKIFKNFSNHPNMVKYIGTWVFRNLKNQPSHIWLVMEYCEGRSVAELSKTLVQNGSNLNENAIKYISYETLQGISFLHKSHVIHRDIKGPNILLTIEGYVKLIDYGVSAQLRNTMARRHTSVGSPFWMAPEVIACENQLDYTYNNRCDIWSLGITAIELADGDPPLAEEHPMRALFKIPRNPPPTVKNPKKWSPLFMDFITKALRKDFEERPSADELLKNPFLEECAADQTKLRKELMALLHIVVQQYNKTSGGGSSATLDAQKRNAQKNVKMLEIHDLATLPRLTEENLLSYISGRYVADQIYTYIGEILIACNPFKELGIYSDGAKLLYQDSNKDALPPHIFMVASNTYQAMVQKKTDQCCVISGESGSGKTMTANFLIQQFANNGKANKDARVNLKLVKKILQVTPLIEAFGNAQTIINQNSSRFGKFLELHFTESGKLVGAQLAQFLLEKSRVVSQPTAERSFHIMYYMIAGLDFHNRLNEFELSTTNNHRYLNTDELTLAECACTSEYQVRFNHVQKCLEDIGFTKQEIQSLYSILAGIIHLGDVNFAIDDFSSFEGEKAKVVNTYVLDTVAKLLKVEERHLNEALITYTHVANGETIKRNNTVDQAMDCRDATAKALYGRLFTWIVKRINILLRAEDKTEIRHSRIGILDIFGFENLKTNSFEQLCINIANEQLQFYFNEYIFVWEFEEYAYEGIKTASFEFTNNKEILDLFLQKPMGILALLDEESRFPMATDMTLVEKFYDNIESKYMKTKKDASTIFSVNHYAGNVTYDTTGFLEKNRDTLSPDVIETLQLSDDETIGNLFKETSSSSGMEENIDQKKSLLAATSRFQQTVSLNFRLSLRSLMSKIIKSDPNFVRCIRPNLQNRPNLLDQDKVLQQLRYTGILETTKIRKQGYSDRITFQQFADRYKFLLFNESEELTGTADICLNLLRASKIDEEDESWKIGKTKVFLRYWHAQKLSGISQQYQKKVIKCQAAIRTFLLKRSMKAFGQVRRKAADKIRANWLAWVTNKRFKKMLAEYKAEQERLRGKSNMVDDTEIRPFYKNMKRREIAYLPTDDMDLMANKKSNKAARDLRPQKKKEKGGEEEDAEGRAALEETQSIILLLQIELACKEVLETLNRTAYPVIHSSRAKTMQSEGAPKMRPQQLDHREKQLAMLDGYSDPLDQTYRHAKLHHGENERVDAEHDTFESRPMLGLVERPQKDQKSGPSGGIQSSSNDATPQPKKKNSKKKPNEKPKASTMKGPPKSQQSTKQPEKKSSATVNKKPATKAPSTINKKPIYNKAPGTSNRKPERPASVNRTPNTSSLKKTPANDYGSKNKVREISDFGTGNRVHKEKQFFENRFQRSTPPSSVNRYPTANRQVNPDRFNRNYSPAATSYDHKPYNYLLNDRKDPRNSFSGGTATFNNFKAPRPMNQNDYVVNNYLSNAPPRQPPQSDYQSHRPYYDLNAPHNPSKPRRVSGFQYGDIKKESALRDLRLKKTGRLQHLVY